MANLESVVDSHKMRRRSAVWTFFTVCENDQTRAKCNICEARISRGSGGRMCTTSSLFNHLKFKHPQEFKFTKRNQPTLAIKTESDYPNPETQAASQVRRVKSERIIKEYNHSQESNLSSSTSEDQIQLMSFPDLTLHSNTILSPVEKQAAHPHFHGNKPLKQWTEGEIDEWLESNDLKSHRLWFNNFDGSLLQEYAFMMRDAPESFYSHLFKHNISIRDVLSIGKALRQLLLL